MDFLLTIGETELLTRFGLGCALAALVGLLMTGPVIARRGLGYGAWIRLCVCVIPCAWLTARLVYVTADLVMTPLEAMFDLNTGRSLEYVPYFWEGGYALTGAVIGAVLGGKLAELWSRSPKGALRDALAVGIPAAILVERLFEAGTGLGEGRIVGSSWLIGLGICPLVEGDPVHPVYLYEAIVAGILLILMIIASLLDHKHEGNLLRGFLVLFGLTQVLLESMRADDHMVEHFVHIQQVVAIVIPVAVMIHWSVVSARKPGRHPALTIGWIVTAAAIGGAILAEFGVDRWGNLLLAYGVMAGCMLVVGFIALEFKRIADRG
ncbi:MAG: prolipoprotein diacylglyceryl transferase [Clostridia bacterium]|nr:prolipoprotein diacylglyceryl transferase [Clostridia bacterium]